MLNLLVATCKFAYQLRDNFLWQHRCFAVVLILGDARALNIDRRATAEPNAKARACTPSTTNNHEHAAGDVECASFVSCSYVYLCVGILCIITLYPSDCDRDNV